MSRAIVYLRSILPPGDPNNDAQVAFERTELKTWAEARGHEMLLLEDHGPPARLYQGFAGDMTGIHRLMTEVATGQYDYLILPTLAAIGRSVQFTREILESLMQHGVRLFLLEAPDTQVDVGQLLPGLVAAGRVEAVLNQDRLKVRSRAHRRRMLVGPPTPSAFDSMSAEELLEHALDAAWLARRHARRVPCTRAEEHDCYIPAEAYLLILDAGFTPSEDQELCPGGTCMVSFAIREVEVLLGRMKDRLPASPPRNPDDILLRRASDQTSTDVHLDEGGAAGGAAAD